MNHSRFGTNLWQSCGKINSNYFLQLRYPPDEFPSLSKEEHSPGKITLHEGESMLERTRSNPHTSFSSPCLLPHFFFGFSAKPIPMDYYSGITRYHSMFWKWPDHSSWLAVMTVACWRCAVPLNLIESIDPIWFFPPRKSDHFPLDIQTVLIPFKILDWLGRNTWNGPTCSD